MGRQPKNKISGPPPRPPKPSAHWNECPYCRTELGVYGHCENCGAPVHRQPRAVPPPGPSNLIYRFLQEAEPTIETLSGDGRIIAVDTAPRYGSIPYGLDDVRGRPIETEAIWGKYLI